MSLFANSGFLYAGSVNLKREQKKVQVELLHNSVRTLTKELDDGDRNMLGVSSRVKKTRNRKFNLDYRSVWYDGIVDENDGTPPATPLSFGYNLRKASSLDSLLKSSTTSNMKRQLTKDMISAPRSPRKIINWNDFDKIDKLTELDSSTEQLSENIIIEETVSDDLGTFIIPSDNVYNESEPSSTFCSEITENDDNTENIVTEIISIGTVNENEGRKMDKEVVGNETDYEIEVTTTVDTGNDQDDRTIEVDSGPISVSSEHVHCIFNDEIILRKKDTNDIPQITIGTDINTQISKFGRSSVDFGRSMRSSVEYNANQEDVSPEDIHITLRNDAILKVQTLDRYKRKNLLKSQLSFSLPRTETEESLLEKLIESPKIENLEDIIGEDISRKNGGQVLLDIPRTQALNKVEKGNAKFLRKLVRKENISPPFDVRHIRHAGKNVVVPVDDEFSPSNLTAMKFLSENILMNKDPQNIPELTGIGTENYTQISKFGRASSDFGRSVSVEYNAKKEHQQDISSEDMHATVETNAFSKVQTLDRYKRKTMLQRHLSFSPPSPETRQRILTKFEKSKRNYLGDIISRRNVLRELFSSVPKSQTLVRVEKYSAKFKRKPFRKQDISAPFNLRHISHVGRKVEHKDAEKSSSNLSAMKFLSKSTDEVLRNLQTNKDEPVSRGVGPFPRTDDTNFLTADVQIRSNRLGDNRSRQSKTMEFDFPRRSPSKTQDFDVKGVTKIQLPSSNSQIKLEKNEYIKYQNSTIFTANDSQGKLQPLKYNVILKSIKSLNKREVELRDSSNQVYLLIFDSSKDSKHFMENEKVTSLLDNKTTLSKTLLRLLGKRSSREVLEKKGIYQNEPIFGNTLRNIFNSEKGVPRFITKTMDLIENHENVISLGLYRACGNLATIQKIRLEVDKGNLDILDTYSKDPDVLTGGLKLFFRELKEPLMSCQTCDNLLGIIKNNKNYSSKDKVMIRTILSHLPEANSETLSVLLQHLVEVVKYKDQNKMDTYNLATCWGPTVIFATESSDSNYTKDIVTQSAEATRLFDSLLTYYSMYPEELDFTKRKHDYLDSNKSMLHRQDSKDSIHSSDSGHSKLQKKSSSSLSLEGIDEAVKKCVELIENTSTDGVHKKSGSTERVNKIVKKMTKKKIAEMEKHKNDVYELTEALKKYLKQDSERLVTKEAVEQIKKFCDIKNCLEHSTRQKVISIIRDLPKKETLIFLLRHILKLIEKEEFYRDSKSDLFSTWSKILTSEQAFQSEESATNFLKILLEVFDETKSDISMKPKGIPDGLLESLKNHPNMKDRVSKYDNVPDETDFNKEETILEEKTDGYENTKL